MKDEDIPMWAIDRAIAMVGTDFQTQLHYSVKEFPVFTTFARYIAEREQPPVDLLLIEAREICSIIEGQNKGYQFTSGERDDYPSMQIALAALRRGIELAKEPK